MELFSDLSKDICVEKLEEAISSKDPESQTFLGAQEKDRFEIVRKVSYVNSFMPIVYGEFKGGENGTFVKLKFSMHLYVKIFLVLFYLCIGSYAFYLLVFEGRLVPIEEALIFLVPIGIAFSAYQVEKLKTLECLKRLFFSSSGDF